MMGTELGRTLSAKEPRCVGELLLFANDGSGGCSITQTCCCPPLGGDEILLLLLLLPCFKGEPRSGSGLSGFSKFSTNKKNIRVTLETNLEQLGSSHEREPGCTWHIPHSQLLSKL